MTTLRETAQQALEALEAMNPYPASKEDQRASALAALRAALAQQDEPCPNCSSLEAQNTELDRKLSELERAESAQEPVDVALLEYRGNSVAFIHQKMTAYRTGIDAAWDAFKAKGLHPDGKTSLADMIAKYTAPPQRQPQTIDEAMQQPRAMAQAYENGYKAGAAAERKRIIQFLQEMQRQVGDGHNHYGVAAVQIRERA